jgi:hypothetical protein
MNAGAFELPSPPAIAQAATFLEEHADPTMQAVVVAQARHQRCSQSRILGPAALMSDIEELGGAAAGAWLSESIVREQPLR